MEKNLVARKLAESLRGLNMKMNAIQELTGWEVHEHYTEVSELAYLLFDLLDVPPWDADKDVVYDYLNGAIEYGDMLVKVKLAQDAFVPDDYLRYLDSQEALFGGDSR